MKIVHLLPLAVLLLSQAPANAQGIRGALGAISNGVNSRGPQRAVVPAGSFARYLRVATDQGIKALEELSAAFPPDKVAHLKELTNDYHRATATQTEIDGEAFTIATDAATEMATLEQDWQSYNKDAGQKVRRAHARLGLMLAVDAYAATAAPAEKTKLQAEATAAGNSVMNVFRKRTQTVVDQNNEKRFRDEIDFLNKVTQQLPVQQKSFTSVQRIARNIADAEHFQLRPDPPRDSITTTSDVEKSAREIDAAFPG